MNNALIVQEPVNLDLLKRNVKSYYRPIVNRLVKFLKLKKMMLTPESVKAYLKNLGNCSASTYNLHLAAIKDRVRAVSKHETNITKLYHRDRELKEIKNRKIKNKAVDLDKILSPGQVKILVAGASPRIACILKILWFSALRISELINIQLVNMKPEGQYYNIRIKGKGGIEDIIKIPRSLIMEAKKIFKGKVYLLEENGKTLDRNSLTNSIKYFSLKVLGKHCTAHTLRHSRATQMYESTKDIIKVSRYLRHSSIEITARLYIHDKGITWKELQELSHRQAQTGLQLVKSTEARSAPEGGSPPTGTQASTV